MDPKVDSEASIGEERNLPAYLLTLKSSECAIECGKICVRCKTKEDPSVEDSTEGRDEGQGIEVRIFVGVKIFAVRIVFNIYVLM